MRSILPSSLVLILFRVNRRNAACFLLLKDDEDEDGIPKTLVPAASSAACGTTVVDIDLERLFESLSWSSGPSKGLPDPLSVLLARDFGSVVNMSGV